MKLGLVCLVLLGLIGALVFGPSSWESVILDGARPAPAIEGEQPVAALERSDDEQPVMALERSDPEAAPDVTEPDLLDRKAAHDEEQPESLELESPGAEPADSGAWAPEPPAPRHLRLPGGTMVSAERYYSESIDRVTWYQIILPPGYDASNRSYPVLYMLHGAMGGAQEWLEIGLHEAADHLWSQGELEHFIIVLPEGETLTYWLNHADGGPRYGDLVTHDIVAQIDAHYRTMPEPAFRAVGGLSMGGDGALRLALTRPDVFGIAGAHSPTTRQTYDERPGAFYGDQEYWEKHNSLWLIRNSDTAELLKIWIDVGELDPWVFSAYRLNEALVERGVEHEFSVLEGGHDGDYWIANQGRYLGFYGDTFRDTLQLTASPRETQPAQHDEQTAEQPDEPAVEASERSAEQPGGEPDEQSDAGVAAPHDERLADQSDEQPVEQLVEQSAD